jgi:hypothetical protein
MQSMEHVKLSEEIISVIGKIVLYGGGIAGVSFGLIKWFGEKWFENKFSERLEEFRRQQSEILEQYRYQINANFSRITKIHDKEFEVLPKVWRLLQESYSHFMFLANPGQQWPDLNRYNQDELQSFLDKCELMDFQKKELLKQEDKLAYYENKAYWARLGRARTKFQEFREFLRNNKIFLRRDLFDLFRKIEISMIEVEVGLEMPSDIEYPWRGTSESFKKLNKDVNDLMAQVESSVQERLHFDRA